MSDNLGGRSVWVTTAFEVRRVTWGLPDGPTERFTSETAAQAYEEWLRRGIAMYEGSDEAR